MLKPAAWAAVPGKTDAEKFAYLGIVPGKTADIRKLGKIADNYGVTIWLFFEEDMARNRPLASVLSDIAGLPEYESPVIRVGSFLRFTQENDPSFEQTMEEFPLMVEVVAVTEMAPDKSLKPEPVVTCLMPFLDELDLDAAPPAPGIHDFPPAKK